MASSIRLIWWNFWTNMQTSFDNFFMAIFVLKIASIFKWLHQEVMRPKHLFQEIVLNLVDVSKRLSNEWNISFCRESENLPLLFCFENEFVFAKFCEFWFADLLHEKYGNFAKFIYARVSPELVTSQKRLTKSRICSLDQSKNEKMTFCYQSEQKIITNWRIKNEHKSSSFSFSGSYANVFVEVYNTFAFPL